LCLSDPKQRRCQPQLTRNDQIVKDLTEIDQDSTKISDQPTTINDGKDPPTHGP
jgi:hypothetical protein